MAQFVPDAGTFGIVYLSLRNEINLLKRNKKGKLIIYLVFEIIKLFSLIKEYNSFFLRLYKKLKQFFLYLLLEKHMMI